MAGQVIGLSVQPCAGEIHLFMKGPAGPTTVRIELWAHRYNARTHTQEAEVASGYLRAVDVEVKDDPRAAAAAILATSVAGRVDGSISAVRAIMPPCVHWQLSGSRLVLRGKTAATDGGESERRAVFLVQVGTAWFSVEKLISVWDEKISDWGFGQDALVTVEDAFLAHAQPTIYARVGGERLADITGHGYVNLSTGNPLMAKIDDTTGRVRGIAAVRAPNAVPGVAGAGITTLTGVGPGNTTRTIALHVVDMLKPRTVSPLKLKGDIDQNYNLLFLSAGFDGEEEEEFRQLANHLFSTLTKPRHAPFHALRHRINGWMRFEPLPVSGAPRSIKHESAGRAGVWRPSTLFELKETDGNPDEMGELIHPLATSFTGPLGRYIRTLRPAHDFERRIGETEWSYEASGPHAGRLGKSAGLVCVILRSRRMPGGTHFGAYFCVGTNFKNRKADAQRENIVEAHGAIPLVFGPSIRNADWGAYADNFWDNLGDIFVHEFCHGFALGDEYGPRGEVDERKRGLLNADQSSRHDNVGPAGRTSRADIENAIPWTTLERIARADVVLAASAVALGSCSLRLEKGRVTAWAVGAKVRVREGYRDATTGAQTKRSRQDGQLHARTDFVPLAAFDATVTRVDAANDRLDVIFSNGEPGPNVRIAVIYTPAAPLADGRGSPLDRDFFETSIAKDPTNPALGTELPTTAIDDVPIAGSKGETRLSRTLMAGAVALRKGGGGYGAPPPLVSPSSQCKMNEHKGGKLCFVCRYLIVNRIDPSVLGEVDALGPTEMKYPGYKK